MKGKEKDKKYILQLFSPLSCAKFQFIFPLETSLLLSVVLNAIGWCSQFLLLLVLVHLAEIFLFGNVLLSVRETQSCVLQASGSINQEH